MSSESRSPARGSFPSLAICCTVLLGCSSSDRVTATGKIAFGGEPVEAGAIIFRPVDGGGTPHGALITAGRYAIECQPGRHRVEIRGTRPMKESRTPTTMPRLGTAAIREDYIPAAFNSESTLEVEVKAGSSNVFDFDLVATPSRH